MIMKWNLKKLDGRVGSAITGSGLGAVVHSFEYGNENLGSVTW
jgi:hypothetical protein